jgi:hypothetical protein
MLIVRTIRKWYKGIHCACTMQYLCNIDERGTYSNHCFRECKNKIPRKMYGTKMKQQKDGDKFGTKTFFIIFYMIWCRFIRYIKSILHVILYHRSLQCTARESVCVCVWGGGERERVTPRLLLGQRCVSVVTSPQLLTLAPLTVCIVTCLIGSRYLWSSLPAVCNGAFRRAVQTSRLEFLTPLSLRQSCRL